MKGVVSIWLVAVVMGSAAVTYAAIPNDGGRTWKTESGGYRVGFAAGGADMLAVLNAEFGHYAADVIQRDIRSASECLARMSTLSDLRRAVDSLVTYLALPSPHGPNDFYVVAAHVRFVLLNFCDRSVPVGKNIPGLDFGFRAREEANLRTGAINPGGGFIWRGILAYVTIAEWGSDAKDAWTRPFRHGYVAGAANMWRHVASLLRERPATEVRQKVQTAHECVRSKYAKLDALHRRLDAEVSKDTAGGHNYTIASTLYALLVDCP